MSGLEITALVENESCRPDLEARHGLCLHIRTPARSILFDLGKDTLFLENAKKLGIDVGLVETVVLSHGHADHGGALPHFLASNTAASVYIRDNAFTPLFLHKGGEFVTAGLTPEYENHPQIIFTGESCRIDDIILLFSGVKPDHLNPQSNKFLYQKQGEEYVRDDFSHEQNMIITFAGKHILFTGCAHCGIVNILQKAEELIGGSIDIAIGGFHLFNPGTMENESDELIGRIAEELRKRSAKFLTCHCTGKYAYELMKRTLGEQIEYFATGSVLQL